MAGHGREREILDTTGVELQFYECSFMSGEGMRKILDDVWATAEWPSDSGLTLIECIYSRMFI